MLNYTGANLTITPAPLSITANSTSKIYGQALTFANTEFTANGLQNNDAIDTVTITATNTPFAGTETNAPVGSYQLVPSSPTGVVFIADNYNITYNNGTLTVNPALLAITANDTNRIYGTTNPVFTATYSGFVNGEDASLVTGSPTLTNATVLTNSPVGYYSNSIVVVDAGTLAATNYAFTDSTLFTNGTLTVSKAAILVQADDKSRLYGQTNPVFTASYSGFVDGEDTNILTGAPSLTTTADTNSSVGSYTITSALGGLVATNYSFVFSNGTLTIDKTPLSITANDDSKTYDGVAYSGGNGVTYVGFVNGETNDVLGGTLSYTNSSQGAINAGSYVITPQGLTSDNYDLSFDNGELVISQRVATVVADAKSKTFGATNPVLTAVVTGQVSGGDVIQYTLATTATPTSTVGAYPITVTLDSNPNYSVTSTNSTLTVNPVTPTLVISSATAIKYSQPLSASVISGSAANPNDNSSVAGTFSFTFSNNVPLATAAQAVTFTPGDTLDYTGASGLVSVPVIDPAIFVQPVDVTIPHGSNATFSVTAAGSGTLHYQWQQNGVNLPGQTASTLTLNNVPDSSAGQYSVVITNANGTAVSSNATLTLTHPPIFASQPASLVVTQGSTVSFTVSVNGTSPFHYQWQKYNVNLSDGGNVSGATAKKLILSNVTGSDTAGYSVIVTNLDGSNISSSAALTVIVPPAITTQPLSLTNLAGGTAVFTVTNTGSPSVYRWYKGVTLLSDGGNIFGSTGNVLTITNNLGADGAIYSVTISNAAALVTSSNATLTVIDPIITGQPVSRTNNLGTAASFTVSAYGTSPQYRWLKNGVSISGATSATYSIASVAVTDEAPYSVVVSNAFGVVTSAPPATLTVISPPVIVAQPLSRTNNAGTTATFTVGYTGTAPTFQWYKGVSLIANETNATLTLLNVQQGDALDYKVVLSNAAGTVTSSNAHLTVIDAPVIVSQPSSQTNNAGQTATFTVSYNGTAPSFQWFKNGSPLSNAGNVSGATSATLTLASVQDMDMAGYTVSLSNAAGSVTSAPPATLTVISPPVIVAQPLSRTNNAGTTATFTVGYTGTAPTFQWYKGVSLIANETNATLTLLNVQQGDALDYKVVLSNAAGTVTSSNAHLTVIDPPVITAQPLSRTNNAGTTATFTVGYTGTAPIFQWFKNSTNALANGGNISGANSPTLTVSNVFGIDRGIYSVVVSNAAAVGVSSNATLAVVDPFITSQPVGVTNINSSTVVFSVGVTGTAPLSYQWYQDGSLLDGETGSSLTLTDIADSDAGEYTVVVTNIYGSATSVPAVLVTVTPLIVTQPTSVVALVGQSVNFSVNVNGATPFSYQWQKNGTNVTGANNRILSFASVALTDAGSYRVFVTNPNGTQLSDTATLSVYTSTVPQLAFSYSNSTATINLTGVPGYNYAIQASTNLVNWLPLQTSTSPFTFTDTNRFDKRFYRGAYLP